MEFLSPRPKHPSLVSRLSRSETIRELLPHARRNNAATATGIAHAPGRPRAIHRLGSPDSLS